MKIVISFLCAATTIIIGFVLIWAFVIFEQWIYSMFGFVGAIIAAVVIPVFIGLWACFFADLY